MIDSEELAKLRKTFYDKVIRRDGCWLWCDVPHYGMSTFDGKSIGTHRLSWMIQNGPIPNGMMVLHRCDTRACINPKHLYLGTAKDNIRDCVARKRHPELQRTHCERGHPFSGDNLHITKQGHRRCKTCKTQWNRERYL